MLAVNHRSTPRPRPITIFGWIVVLLCLTISGRAGAALDIDSGFTHLPVGSCLETLADPRGGLTVDQVNSPDRERLWVRSRTDTPGFGFTDTVYWARFSLNLGPGSPPKLILELENPHLYEIDLYRLSEDRSTWTLLIRQRAELSQPERRRNPTFELSPEPGGTTSYCLRLATQGSMQFPLTLWSETTYWQEETNNQFIFGGYFCMLLIMAVYNLFLFFGTKDRAYLLYVFYILSLVAFQLFLTGYALELISPSLLAFFPKGFSIICALLLLSALLFSRQFLNTRELAPNIDRMILVLVGANLLFPLIPLTSPAMTVNIISGLMSGLVCLALILAGIFCWLKGLRSARFYLLSWIALLGSGIILVFLQFGYLERTFLAKHAIMIGSLLEVTLLSFALSDRINDLRRDKAAAQAEALEYQRILAEELTLKVEERTRELELEIQARKEIEEDLKKLAVSDPLVGIYNRRYFFERGEAEIRRALRYKRPLAIILFDLDYFKMVNDNYGHSIGDLVLTEIVTEGSAVLRETDVFARYGGEEFIVLCPETGPEEAASIAERLRTRIENLSIPTDAGSIRVTISLGVSCFDSNRELSLYQVIDLADKALYISKDEGRNRSTVWGDPAGMH